MSEIIKELFDEFTEDDVLEISAYIICGCSVDDAIQRVIEK